MMDRFELQRFRDLPIEGVAERLGLRVTRHKSLCPFHDDHHASLSFSVRRNTFRCFACGASGGTIDLVMKLLNKDFKEACRWLADEHNVIFTSSSTIENKPLPPSQGAGKTELLSVPAGLVRGVGRFARFFERPWLSPEARRFLFEERRLDPRVVRWCRLTSWKDRQGVSWLQIPYYDRQGKLVGVQNRNLCVSSSSKYRSDQRSSAKYQASALPSLTGGGGGGSFPRFRFPAGSECGIYNLPVLNRLRPGDELYITEGCSDCWAMLSSGHKAIAIPSATLLTQKDVEQLSIIQCQLSINYHMYPDRDEPGERLFLQLQKVIPSLVHHQLPLGCKDYSDYYLQTRFHPPDNAALYI